MSSNAAVLVVCALTLGVTAYVAVNLPAGGGLAGVGGSGGGAEDRLAALERQTTAMTATLRDLRDSVARIDQRLSGGRASAGRVQRGATRADVPSAADGGSGSPPSAGTGVPDANGGAVASDLAGSGDHAFDVAGDAVATRLEKRIEAVAARERARGADGKWKAPIDELADELGADAAAKADITRVFDDGRDQMCRVLLTARSDGASLLDDYAREIRDTGDGEAATKQFFKRVVADKVPGTDETYFTAILRVHETVERGLAQRLGDERMAKLRALRVDLLDVTTGHDPVGDALRERLQK